MAPGTKVKLVLVVVSLALATLPLSSWASQGHTKTFQSNVTIHAGGNQFNGHVGTAAVCQVNRTVNVYDAGTATIVGTATTGPTPNGQWGGIGVPGPGSYYAVAPQVTVGGYQGVTCLAGTSHTITVK